MRPIYIVISIISSITVYVLLIQNSLIDINTQIGKIEYVDVKNQKEKMKREKNEDYLIFNKVYCTDLVAGSSHFLLLNNGFYYHVHTNKTNSLTAKELKSSSITEILNKKQSSGQAFITRGRYLKRNGTIYTEKYWDSIKVITSKKIKYLNKIYYLCNDQ